MRKEQYEALQAAAEAGDYLSIAINEDGAPVQGCFIPWERTVSAFNMKTPKVTLSVKDLDTPEIMGKLGQCKLTGCYLFAPMDDYGFLSSFSTLNDLFILHGERMRNLSYIHDMPELFLFYLENAALPDLSPLIENCNRGSSLPGKCFGFYHCSVADTSALSDIRFSLSELLIWPVEGDQRERWSTARRAGTFRFYEKKHGPSELQKGDLP